MKVGEDGHNLPGQQYPIGRAQHAFHQPQHRQHSSRRQLGHRPFDRERGGVSQDIGCYNHSPKRAVDGSAVANIEQELTSGKVPFEKTL